MESTTATATATAAGFFHTLISRAWILSIMKLRSSLPLGFKFHGRRITMAKLNLFGFKIWLYQVLRSKY